MTALANPYQHVKAAAQGDVNAMRALADHSVAMLGQNVADPERTLLEGLIFARMAAVVGDNADKGRVLSMLALIGCFASSEASEADYFAEGIAMASILADRGEELAADGVNLLSEQASPEILAMAKAYELVLKDIY